MPLEGRVDLMRPKRPEPVQQERLVPKILVAADDSPPPLHLDLDPLATPRANSPTRMTTLPTPSPSQVPPAPHHNPLSLPPSPFSPGQQQYQQQTKFGQFLVSPPQYGAPDSDQFDEFDTHVADAHDPHWSHHSSRQHRHHISNRQRHVYHEVNRRQENGDVGDEDFRPTNLLTVFNQARDDGQSSEGDIAKDEYPFPPRRKRQAPVSPPVVAWNPAVEPPPKAQPVLSSVLPDTYYPNIWDKAPSKLHDATHQYSKNRYTDVSVSTSDSGSSTPSQFFKAPSPGEIPEDLVREGHYLNVIGPMPERTRSPTPDRSKVAPIFPWEEKPRVAPGRVFPSTDAPPPGDFLIQKAASPVVHFGDLPGSFSSPGFGSHGSPPINIPISLTYKNAWDVEPTIQKYASKLARPDQNAPRNSLLFQNEEWRKHEKEKFSPWQAKEEETSMDGDDEDDSDDAAPPRHSRQRSRAGSGTATPQGSLFTYKGKYRGRGIQTEPPERRSRGVQVTPKAQPEEYPTHTSSPRVTTVSRNTSRRSSYGDLPPAPLLSRPVSTDSPPLVRSPRVLISPRTYSPPRGNTPPVMSPRYSPVQTPRRRPSTSSPVRERVLSPLTLSMRSVPALARSASNETALSSSVGPPSPDMATTPIKSTRVWDPARGVDIFKKGSEEVLSRFLRMGSFDEGSATPPQSR